LLPGLFFVAVLAALKFRRAGLLGWWRRRQKVLAKTFTVFEESC